ncbi:MAG: hypothetical protein GXP35_13360, partial [Actinobacteria bacterium]|nr:hypothetical protein [Actinomycetota bacterium]
MKRLIRTILATLMIATTLQAISIPPAGAAFTDEESFTATTLGGQWTEAGNGLGGGFFQYPGGRAALSVPESIVSYQPWTSGNRAPSLRQATTNTDFDVVSVFATTPSERFQIQGIVVADEGSGDFIRFDVHFDGTNMRALAAFLDDSNSTATEHISVATPSAGHASYIRVRRVGNNYTFYTSDNGTTWTSHGTFTRAMAVTSLAPFVGNAVPGPGQSAPAYSGLIDYFGALDENATPGVPLDDILPASAALGTGDDATSPNPDLVDFTEGTDRITTRWNGPEPVTMNVSITGQGSQSLNNPFPDQTLIFTSLNPLTSYTVTLTLTDMAGNSSQKAYSVTTLAGGTGDGPEFELWHGDNASFGDSGTSQRWVNITGRLTSITGPATLTYQLNGGATRNATVVADTRRLENGGDFNIDLLRSTLINGINTVTLTATDNLGSRIRTVTFTYTGLTDAPSTLLAIDWSNAGSVDSVADVSDGAWTIDGGGLRTLDLGYDRLVTFGDTSWTNFQVRTTFTHNGINTNANGPSSNGPGVGVFLRWNGHNDTVATGSQPQQGFVPDAVNADPIGAIAWWRDSTIAPPQVEITDNSAVIQDTDAFTLTEGETYNLKAQAEGGRYRVKIWKVGDAEPGTWVTQGNSGDAPTTGAVALVAHEMDITFGDVTITPRGASTAATPTFTPNTGVVNEGDTISIGGEAGGRVFYTTDGSTPKPSDEEATFGIPVAGGDTIRAIQYVDEKDPSAVATATFTINGAPSVEAGADASIESGEAATLDGSASDDGVGGGSLTVSWRKVSGPGTVTFADGSSTETSATFSLAGVYVLALDANDGSILRTDTLTITVDANGYWLVDAAGNLYNFGGKQDLGDVAGGTLTNPISTMASTPNGAGYWITDVKGKVDAFGTATDNGDLPGLDVDPAFPIVNMAANPNGGYYLLGGDGGVFS